MLKKDQFIQLNNKLSQGPFGFPFEQLNLKIKGDTNATNYPKIQCITYWSPYLYHISKISFTLTKFVVGPMIYCIAESFKDYDIDTICCENIPYVCLFNKIL
jgi:hypothetical protein